MTAEPRSPLTEARAREYYRTLMNPVDRRTTDITHLAACKEAAEELGRRAFLDRERSAWEVVQIIEWRIQRRTCYRPIAPVDVLVLSILYEIENRSIPEIEVPEGRSPEAFCRELRNHVMRFSATESRLMKVIASGELELEDWRYLAYQWISSTIDFTRAIAVASLPLPRPQARLLIENLYDEAGRGDWSRSHYIQLRNLLTLLEIDIEDEAQMLAWTVPEVLALVNTQNRLLWQTGPEGALGALYLVEQLIPTEMTEIRRHLAALDFSPEDLGYLDEHMTVDIRHSEEWLGIIADLIRDHEAQQLVFNAAVQQGRAQRAAWDAAYEGWRKWKETGEVVHLPFERYEEEAQDER